MVSVEVVAAGMYDDLGRAEGSEVGVVAAMPPRLDVGWADCWAGCWVGAVGAESPKKHASQLGRWSSAQREALPEHADDAKGGRRLLVSV